MELKIDIRHDIVGKSGGVEELNLKLKKSIYYNLPSMEGLNVTECNDTQVLLDLETLAASSAFPVMYA